MITLQRALTRTFRVPAKRDTSEATAARKARALAQHYGIVIDTSDSRRGDFAAWIMPPAGLPENPIDGNAFCTSWSEALETVEAVAAAVRQYQQPGQKAQH